MKKIMRKVFKVIAYMATAILIISVAALLLFAVLAMWFSNTEWIQNVVVFSLKTSATSTVVLLLFRTYFAFSGDSFK